MDSVVGIDIGGTRIKSALVAPDGTVLRDDVRPTPTNLGDNHAVVLIATVREIVTTLTAPTTPTDTDTTLTDTTPTPIGVVVPGLVDEATGTGVWSANLNWTNLPALALLTEGTRRLIIGGGLSRAGDLLLDPLRELLAQSLPPELDLEVVPAELGDRAAALGAAALARAAASEL